MHDSELSVSAEQRRNAAIRPTPSRCGIQLLYSAQGFFGVCAVTCEGALRCTYAVQCAASQLFQSLIRHPARVDPQRTVTHFPCFIL